MISPLLCSSPAEALVCGVGHGNCNSPASPSILLPTSSKAKTPSRRVYLLLITSHRIALISSAARTCSSPAMADAELEEVRSTHPKAYTHLLLLIYIYPDQKSPSRPAAAARPLCRWQRCRRRRPRRAKKVSHVKLQSPMYAYH